MTKNRSHRVNLGTHAVPGRKGGGRVALFAFSWADYAQLFGLKVGTVQKLARAGAFDPSDLASVLAYRELVGNRLLRRSAGRRVGAHRHQQVAPG